MTRRCPHCQRQNTIVTPHRTLGFICSGCLKPVPPIGPAKAGPKNKAALVKSLAKRDGWICWLCETSIDQRLPAEHDESATLDHVIPRSKGGSNKQTNLKLAHRVCNGMRGNQYEEAA